MKVTAEQVMAQARAVKEDAARRGDELVNMLWIYRDGQMWGMVPMLCPDFQTAVRAIVGCSGSDPVVVIADSYAVLGPDENKRYESLEAAFKAGDPDVSEAICVCVATKEGPGEFASQPYVCEGGKVLWGEVLTGTGIDGGIMRAILMGWTLNHRVMKLDPEGAENWADTLMMVLKDLGIPGLVRTATAETLGDIVAWADPGAMN